MVLGVFTWRAVFPARWLRGCAHRTGRIAKTRRASVRCSLSFVYVVLRRCGPPGVGFWLAPNARLVSAVRQHSHGLVLEDRRCMEGRASGSVARGGMGQEGKTNLDGPLVTAT